MKTIGIVGSRRRDTAEDFRLVKNALLIILGPEDRLVSGGCRKGADSFAECLAREIGVTITIHYLNWANGKGAGLERNTLIARDADVLIACVAQDRKGGTEDTVRKFIKLHGEECLIIV